MKRRLKIKSGFDKVLHYKRSTSKAKAGRKDGSHKPSPPSAQEPASFSTRVGCSHKTPRKIHLTNSMPCHQGVLGFLCQRKVPAKPTFQDVLCPKRIRSSPSTTTPFPQVSPPQAGFKVHGAEIKRLGSPKLRSRRY